MLIFARAGRAVALAAPLEQEPNTIWAEPTSQLQPLAKREGADTGRIARDREPARLELVNRFPTRAAAAHNGGAIHERSAIQPRGWGWGWGLEAIRIPSPGATPCTHRHPLHTYAVRADESSTAASSAAASSAPASSRPASSAAGSSTTLPASSAAGSSTSRPPSTSASPSSSTPPSSAPPSSSSTSSPTTSPTTTSPPTTTTSQQSTLVSYVTETRSASSTPTETPKDDDPSGVPFGAIIGGVIGGIVAVVVIAALLTLKLRKKRRRRVRDSHLFDSDFPIAMDPYYPVSGSQTPEPVPANLARGPSSASLAMRPAATGGTYGRRSGYEAYDAQDVEYVYAGPGGYYDPAMSPQQSHRGIASSGMSPAMPGVAGYAPRGRSQSYDQHYPDPHDPHYNPRLSEHEGYAAGFHAGLASASAQGAYAPNTYYPQAQGQQYGAAPSHAPSHSNSSDSYMYPVVTGPSVHAGTSPVPTRSNTMMSSPSVMSPPPSAAHAPLPAMAVPPHAQAQARPGSTSDMVVHEEDAGVVLPETLPPMYKAEWAPGAKGEAGTSTRSLKQGL